MFLSPWEIVWSKKIGCWENLCTYFEKDHLLCFLDVFGKSDTCTHRDLLSKSCGVANPTYEQKTAFGYGLSIPLYEIRGCNAIGIFR